MKNFVARIFGLFAKYRNVPLKMTALIVALCVVVVALCVFVYHYWWVVFLVGCGILWLWNENREKEAAEKALQMRRNRGLIEWITYVLNRSTGIIAQEAGLPIYQGNGLARIEPLGNGIFRALFLRLPGAYRLSLSTCGQLRNLLQSAVNRAFSEHGGTYEDIQIVCDIYVIDIVADNKNIAVRMIPIDSQRAADAVVRYDEIRRAQEAKQSGEYPPTPGSYTGDDD
jgi:hypothetical protein